MKRIDPRLVQDLINYLARRPYHEVYTFIPALDALPDIEDKNGEEEGRRIQREQTP